jgi:hypothetical protein
MKGGEMSSGDQTQAEDEPRGRLTYGGRAWSVESEPEVIDTHEGSALVEVWVKEEGGGGGESG